MSVSLVSSISEGLVIFRMSSPLRFKYAPVDYDKIAQLQSEALQRAKKSEIRLGKFRAETRKRNNFNSRHRMNWVESWEKVNLNDAHLTTNLEEHTKLGYIFGSASSFYSSLTISYVGCFRKNAAI